MKEKVRTSRREALQPFSSFHASHSLNRSRSIGTLRYRRGHYEYGYGTTVFLAFLRSVTVVVYTVTDRKIRIRLRHGRDHYGYGTGDHSLSLSATSLKVEFKLLSV